MVTLVTHASQFMLKAVAHDVFDDGSVLLLPLQGHTAGQVGMLLTLPSGQRYLFTGDTTWTLEGIQQPADRSWLLTRKSLDRVDVHPWCPGCPADTTG